MVIGRSIIYQVIGLTEIRIANYLPDNGGNDHAQTVNARLSCQMQRPGLRG
jgi:hypothetical protein